MAERGNQVSRAKFCCSVCLELLKDPVTPACGHSYCRSCITRHWDSEEASGVYSCLQCAETFTPRPELKTHVLVAVLVEELKKTGEENVCPGHGEAAKLFCRTDRQCICYLCSVDRHKGHDVVLAAAERAERQEELEETRLKIRQRAQDTEGDLKLLQQEADAISGSADRAAAHSDESFDQMIRDLQRRRSEATRRIRSRQEAEERRVKELQEKLEQEVVELKRRDTELEQLAQTRDHEKFLKDCPSPTTLGPSTHPSCTTTRPLRHFEDLTAVVSQVRGQIRDVLTEAGANIAWTLANVDVLLPQPEPEQRADFLKCSREIRLDPNTAHKLLVLSDGNRKVTHVEEEQPYPDLPVRFTGWCQVVSRESLTGRWYWEVQWSGEEVGVAVSYNDISRAGKEEEERGFGNDDKSWSLTCSNNSYNFYHNNIKTAVSGPVSSRVGVYLDHSAGVLSFYSVSDTMTLIHRVRTTFTQPLHAGLWVGYGSSAEFCKLK